MTSFQIVLLILFAVLAALVPLTALLHYIEMHRLIRSTQKRVAMLEKSARFPRDDA